MSSLYFHSLGAGLNLRAGKNIREKSASARIRSSIPKRETPYFLFYKNEFRRLLKQYSELGQVYYPVKANDHVDILREVILGGGKFEVDGINQVMQLASLGVNMRSIQYGIPVRKNEEISEAVQLGVNRFVVDTEEEYRRVGIGRKDFEFMLRVSISDILKLDDPRYLKWGMRIQSARELGVKIENDGHKFLGLSFYLPSEVFNHKRFLAMINHIEETFHGTKLSVLDVGGGLDDSNTPSFRMKLAEVRKELQLDTIIVEPGRNLLDPCIDLVVSVIDVCQRGGDKWAFLDAGIYSGLLDHILKKRRFRIIKAFEPSSIRANKQTYMLSGPTSDSLDLLGKYSFAAPIVAGDRLLVKNCGAYTYVLRTHFGAPEMGFESV